MRDPPADAHAEKVPYGFDRIVCIDQFLLQCRKCFEAEIIMKALMDLVITVVDRTHIAFLVFEMLYRVIFKIFDALPASPFTFFFILTDFEKSVHG